MSRLSFQGCRTLRRTEPQAGRRRVRYRHAPMEATGLPGGCADVVAASFVIHECRPFAIRALIAEARRLLRPRGVLLLADNNPRHAPLLATPLSGSACRTLLVCMPAGNRPCTCEAFHTSVRRCVEEPEAKDAAFPRTVPAWCPCKRLTSVDADAAVVVAQVKNHPEPATCALHAYEVD